MNHVRSHYVCMTMLECKISVMDWHLHGRPFEEDIIISSHLVTSWLECANECLKNRDCATFGYSDSQVNDVNCMISGASCEFVIKSGIDGDDDDDNLWKIYKLRTSAICSTLHPCQNNGRCVKDGCEPEGYSCSCPHWYYGKHCENENGDFDVLFQSQQPEPAFIEMDDVINSDLSEFAFSAWFKFSVKLQSYQMVSYMVNGTDGHINLYFKGKTNQGIDSFFVQVAGALDALKTLIIPVDDNAWHHFGFAWDNANGRWDVLIDGTPRALRSNFQTGSTIPGGGRLVIGQKYVGSQFASGEGFLGQLSNLNIWDRALTGEELEELAHSPDAGRGNILRWFQILGNVRGALEIVTPSKARNTNTGLDFELHFGSDTSGRGILAPGPDEPIEQLTVCLWLKTSVASTFVSYHVEDQDNPALSFGVDSKYHLFAHINGDLVNSAITKNAIVNDHWQFLCLIWDGENGAIAFYHQGGMVDTQTGNRTAIPPGGNFLIGATKDDENGSGLFSGRFVGTLSGLNIWSVMQHGSVLPMSSGAMNVNGDVLAWRNVLHLNLQNVTIVPNTIIYYPGYNLAAKRSKWCNEHVTSLSCNKKPLYARLGIGSDRNEMLWRCYCGEALTPSTYSYSTASSPAYETKHDEILAIN